MISTNPNVKEEAYFFIALDIPILDKMTFVNNDYELIFERSITPSSSQGTQEKTAVRYWKNVMKDGKMVHQPLLTRLFERIFTEKSVIRELEQTYTYAHRNFIKLGDKQDKYTYTKGNNIIYGINEFEKKGVCNFLHGICFEDTNVPIKDYLPIRMSSRANYPLLTDEATKSAIILNLKTPDGIRHTFEAYKRPEFTAIKYHSKKYCYEGECHVEELENKEYQLENLVDGSITSEEIASIIASLEEVISDDAVLSLIITELSAFSKKIDIRKQNIEKDLDYLSPRLLANKSFTEIAEIVSADKEAYFNLISSHFESLTNCEEEPKQGPKVLKPTKIDN